MLWRTDNSATQRRRATIFRPATAAAHITYDRHISKRQSLNAIFTRVNPSIGIKWCPAAVVPSDVWKRVELGRKMCTSFRQMQFCRSRRGDRISWPIYGTAGSTKRPFYHARSKVKVCDVEQVWGITININFINLKFCVLTRLIWC